MKNNLTNLVPPPSPEISYRAHGPYPDCLVGGALMEREEEAEKVGRLINNPLGIFGHASCSAQLAGTNLTGIPST